MYLILHFSCTPFACSSLLLRVSEWSAAETDSSWTVWFCCSFGVEAPLRFDSVPLRRRVVTLKAPHYYFRCRYLQLLSCLDPSIFDCNCYTPVHLSFLFATLSLSMFYTCYTRVYHLVAWLKTLYLSDKIMQRYINV